jgi:transposase
MGRSTDKEMRLSEQRKYRGWAAQQKIEIVLAGLRGDRTVKDVCREHEISVTLFYGWRDKLVEGGREALVGKEERSGERAAPGERIPPRSPLGRITAPPRRFSKGDRRTPWSCFSRDLQLVRLPPKRPLELTNPACACRDTLAVPTDARTLQPLFNLGEWFG